MIHHLRSMPDKGPGCGGGMRACHLLACGLADEGATHRTACRLGLRVFRVVLWRAIPGSVANIPTEGYHICSVSSVEFMRRLAVSPLWQEVNLISWLPFLIREPRKPQPQGPYVQPISLLRGLSTDGGFGCISHCQFGYSERSAGSR